MNEDRYLGEKTQPLEGGDLNIQELVIPLLKHRWEVLLIVVLGLLAAFLYNHLATPIYQAQSTIILQRYGHTNIIREQETEGYNRIYKEDFNTKMNMIESMPVLKELAEKLIDRGYFQREVEKINYFNADKSVQNDYLTRKAKQIKGGLSIMNPEGTNMIYINYQNPDPVLAKDVVNVLADLAVKYNAKEQRLGMKNSLLYLNSQLEKTQKQLREAEADLYEYRKKHDIFQSERDKEYVAKQRSEISTELTNVRSRIKELESQISQIRELKKKKNFTKYNPILSENSILLDLRRDLVKARIRYKELKDRYLKNHPEMVQIENRIEVLKESFERELLINLDRLQYNLNVLKSKEKYLEDSLAALEESAISSTEKDIDYMILERQANSSRELYRTLLSAVKEVNVNMNNRSSSVMYVQAKSEVPLNPIKPKEVLNLMVGLLLGALGGIVLAYGIEYLDQTIHSPDDVKKTTSLDVPSTIPLLRRDVETPAPVYFYQNKKSLFSEGITSLRYHLKVYIPQEHNYILLFTSSMPREGKTLITSNMDLSLDQDG
ncbi:MAG: Wzz/FepE/Etk N-terminal domain-containing protein, partial [bacterium]